MNNTSKKKLYNNNSKRRNNNSKKKKSLKDIVNKYILQKGDICCEGDINRQKLKDHIYDIYQKRDGKEYLDSINNDLLIFIGYLFALQEKNDKTGAKLWNKLDKFMMEGDNINKKKISKLLDELPLYYVLAFIGKFSLLNID